MSEIEEPTSWSIHEAIAVAYEAFVIRFGADVLATAFEALCRDYEEAKAAALDTEEEIGDYLQYPLSMKGSGLDLWVAKARSDPDQAELLTLIGVRWLLARDDLLTRPAHSRVPCSYSEGLADHVSLQLLSQMLYRGRAPYTTCD